MLDLVFNFPITTYIRPQTQTMTNKKENRFGSICRYIYQNSILRTLLLSLPLFLIGFGISHLSSEGDRNSFYQLNAQKSGFVDNSINSTYESNMNLAFMEHNLKTLVEQPFIEEEQKDDIQKIVSLIKEQEQQLQSFVAKWTDEINLLYKNKKGKSISKASEEIIGYSRLYHLTMEFNSPVMSKSLMQMEFALKDYQKRVYPKIRRSYIKSIKGLYSRKGIEVQIGNQNDVYLFSDSFTDVQERNRIKEDKQLREKLKEYRFLYIRFYPSNQGDQMPIEEIFISDNDDLEILGKEIIQT